MSTIDQEAYLKAWNFACHAHRFQKLPGSDTPYVNHVGSVAMEVMVALSRETVDQPDLAVQCALLHDVLEDTDTGFDALRSHFGPDIAQAVLSLSKDASLPDKRSQIEESITRIRQQPREVWIVKLADRITNLQHPPSHWDGVKIRHYREEAMLIHRSLGNASEYLANRLAEKIDSYRRYLTA
ncbi:MAG: bifunctional (p)ppGpp synthetase/guanosine-3',5'-bis(diphosphate) 3'-pyrophosphohydrolase [Gammaproteobacteria bacterium]|nr:bifunctional (p)ppGpp synthetase/guanosine-3',5'-bis(diphosphate) 3'-pyrophosphohydrolase [Gammaproteobacteria bacterium]